MWKGPQRWHGPRHLAVPQLWTPLYRLFSPFLMLCFTQDIWAPGFPLVWTFQIFSWSFESYGPVYYSPTFKFLFRHYSKRFILITSFNDCGSPRSQVPLWPTLDVGGLLTTSPGQGLVPTQHANTWRLCFSGWWPLASHGSVSGSHTGPARNAGQECPRKKPSSHGRGSFHGKLSQHL